MKKNLFQRLLSSLMPAAYNARQHWRDVSIYAGKNAPTPPEEYVEMHSFTQSFSKEATAIFQRKDPNHPKRRLSFKETYFNLKPSEPLFSAKFLLGWPWLSWDWEAIKDDPLGFFGVPSTKKGWRDSWFIGGVLNAVFKTAYRVIQLGLAPLRILTPVFRVLEATLTVVKTFVLKPVTELLPALFEHGFRWLSLKCVSLAYDGRKNKFSNGFNGLAVVGGFVGAFVFGAVSTVFRVAKLAMRTLISPQRSARLAAEVAAEGNIWEARIYKGFSAVCSAVGYTLLAPLVLPFFMPKAISAIGSGLDKLNAGVFRLGQWLKTGVNFVAGKLKLMSKTTQGVFNGMGGFEQGAGVVAYAAAKTLSKVSRVSQSVTKENAPLVVYKKTDSGAEQLDDEATRARIKRALKKPVNTFLDKHTRAMSEIALSQGFSVEKCRNDVHEAAAAAVRGQVKSVPTKSDYGKNEEASTESVCGDFYTDSFGQSEPGGAKLSCFFSRVAEYEDKQTDSQTYQNNLKRQFADDLKWHTPAMDEYAQEKFAAIITRMTPSGG